MTSENSETTNPYESLSPAERQQELHLLLSKLPYQLTKGEPQIVENLKLLNDLTKLLRYSRGTSCLSANILRDAAYATEFGVESLRDTAERPLSEVEMFPGTLFINAGSAGQFDESTVQVIEQREILRLGRRRATQRNSQDHVLYAQWWVLYETQYHQKPSEPLPDMEIAAPAEILSPTQRGLE